MAGCDLREHEPARQEGREAHAALVGVMMVVVTGALIVTVPVVRTLAVGMSVAVVVAVRVR
jgi:hypothetical protein